MAPLTITVADKLAQLQAQMAAHEAEERKRDEQARRRVEEVKAELAVVRAELAKEEKRAREEKEQRRCEEEERQRRWKEEAEERKRLVEETRRQQERPKPRPKSRQVARGSSPMYMETMRAQVEAEELDQLAEEAAVGVNKQEVARAKVKGKRARAGSANAEAGPSKRRKSITPSTWRVCDRCASRGEICLPQTGRGKACATCQRSKTKCEVDGKPAVGREMKKQLKSLEIIAVSDAEESAEGEADDDDGPELIGLFEESMRQLQKTASKLEAILADVRAQSEQQERLLQDVAGHRGSDSRYGGAGRSERDARGGQRGERGRRERKRDW